MEVNLSSANQEATTSTQTNAGRNSRFDQTLRFASIEAKVGKMNDLYNGVSLAWLRTRRDSITRTIKGPLLHELNKELGAIKLEIAERSIRDNHEAYKRRAWLSGRFI
ncbi:MAG TPA: hypothetical protein VKR58_05710 [Aquella sp.]|nr:hypothetical protein [Aquella sp.]